MVNKIWGLLIVIIIGTAAIFIIPFSNLRIYGIWTWDIKEAMDYSQNIHMEKLNKECDWGVECRGSYHCYCSDPPCKARNIDGKDCVSEGHTGTGFLGMTDWDTEYFVCKDYGRMALECTSYFTKEEWNTRMGVK